MIRSANELKAARCRNHVKRLPREYGYVAGKAIKRAGKKELTASLATRFTYKKFLYLRDVKKVIYLRRRERV